MRAVRFVSAVLLLVGIFGCSLATERVMTPSEFSGNCYQAGGRRISCDNIAICDEYLPVFDRSHASRAECGEACQSVYNQQVARQGMDSCWLIIPGAANDYCQRYCRAAYPE